MEKFENVSVTTKANVYFDGKVTSRAVTFANGSSKTLGIMLPGEYEFGTDKPELMEITAGVMDVLLPGQSEWLRVVGGESFNVPGNAKFQLKVSELTDYICSFLDE
ncbi:pyrimidine/purine nucleoside phosphorylase [Corallincola platygyrae]|uniref:Pyrimidine/purine nucleoside phosphorylase n=1 Tax=Corallincola platygyrae TaxID=1193278 RepID=A0ABW4XI64_9GAMM